MRVKILTAVFVIVCALLSVSSCSSKKEASPSILAQLQNPPRKEMNAEAYNHFTNGVIYEEEGRYNEAIKQYELALSYEPLSYDIRTTLASLYLNMNRNAQAIDALLPITHKDVTIYRMLGEAFRRAGQNDEAIEAYRRAWRSDSLDINTNYQLGVLFVTEGRIDEAARYFSTAATSSGDFELFAQIADMYASFQQYDSAASYIDAAIRLNQNDPSLFSRKAVYLYSADRKSESKETLNRGLKRHAGDAHLLAQLIETYNAEENMDSVRFYSDKLITQVTADSENAMIFERIGVVLLRADQRDLAQRIFFKLLESNADNRLSLFYLGRMEIDSSRFEAARPYFDHLISLDSTLADGWTNLAFLYQQKKQLDSAEHVLQLAFNYVKGDRENIRFYFAQILSLENKSDSAIAVLKNAIAEGADTVRALFQTGAEYEKTKRFEKAAEAFELLLTIKPDHHQTLNYYGYMLADRNERLQESLAMIERALTAEPENGAYLDSYAWVLYRLGRFEEALVQIQKAIKSTNNDPIVIEHLGDIQFALGNLESARDAWKTALAFDPDNKSLQEKLKK